MPRRKERRRKPDRAAPDLTPMIDVTFQLLIFFILCTRFHVNEDNYRADLPKDRGIEHDSVLPKEQVTVYCQWDENQGANSYVVAIGARGRKPVPQSFARLNELVIFPSDKPAAVRQKKARYKQVFDNLVAAIQDYARTSGANIEAIEIAFSKDAAEGASSGTAPWMFVSLALDASNQVNYLREQAGQEKLSVAFKFADARGLYG